MQPKYKKATCVAATVCLLAVLAVGMMLGTQGSWYQGQRGIRKIRFHIMLTEEVLY